jgi:hypothetical protein
MKSLLFLNEKKPIFTATCKIRHHTQDYTTPTALVGYGNWFDAGMIYADALTQNIIIDGGEIDSMNVSVAAAMLT